MLTRDLNKIAIALKNAKVVAFPTDTVYGLICNAFEDRAKREIYKLKGRSFNKPLGIFIGKKRDIERYAHVNENAKKLIRKFFPGALTLILKSKIKGKYIVKEGNIAIRMPKHKTLLLLLKKISFPLAQTSANISGKKEATSYKEVRGYFGNKVLIYKGKCGKLKPSTIVDLTNGIKVIRESTINKDEILRCLRKN